MIAEKKQDKLLNAEALGQVLSVSRRHIFRLSASGQIPSPVKIGCSVRWPSSEINAWIQAGCPSRQSWEEMKRSFL